MRPLKASVDDLAWDEHKPGAAMCLYVFVLHDSMASEGIPREGCALGPAHRVGTTFLESEMETNCMYKNKHRIQSVHLELVEHRTQPQCQ